MEKCHPVPRDELVVPRVIFLCVLLVELGMVGGGQLDHLPLGCGGRMRSHCDLSTSEVWVWH